MILVWIGIDSQRYLSEDPDPLNVSCNEAVQDYHNPTSGADLWHFGMDPDANCLGH